MREEKPANEAVEYTLDEWLEPNREEYTNEARTQYGIRNPDPKMRWCDAIDPKAYLMEYGRKNMGKEELGRNRETYCWSSVLSVGIPPAFVAKEFKKWHGKETL